MVIDYSNKKTLAEELELTLERDDVDELGFPRKRLTETQRQYVNKLYDKERGSSGVAIPTTKSVIFEIVKSNDPFGLKMDEPAVTDTPDNKWWHRWNSWLEEKRKEEERRIKKAEEQARIISDAMSRHNNNNNNNNNNNKQPLNQQTIGEEKGKGILL